MGLSGLDTALSGLRIAQQQLNVIAGNVSNVNTDGYSRKILPQETVVVNGASAGVRPSAVIRNVDLNLERDYWTQVSAVSALDVKSTYLDKIQQFHGSPDLEVSIAAEVAQLRDSFASLADSPEDNFLQRAVVDQAGQVAGKINDFADLLNQMRNDTQEDLEISIDKINGFLEKIANLNKQIKFNSASGRTVADLSDQRDKAVRDLSSEISVSFFTRGDGVMVVQTKTGVQLADEHAEELYFSRTPLGPSTYYPNPANPYANGLFVGGNPVDNPVAIDITQSNVGGKVGGLLELRDEILPENLAMLDELAHKMATRFEEQGLTLFTDDTGHVPGDSTASLTGTVDLVTLAGGGPLSPLFGVNDSFTITLNPNGTAPAARTMTIDLSTAEAAYPIPPAANGAVSMVNYINSQIATLPDAYGNTVAALNSSGQLTINSDYDIQISANGAGQMGDTGLATLGLTRGTTYAAPTTSPLTPVPYVGFSSTIRVNPQVLADNQLVQQGTVSTDQGVQEGSNEVIRRILEFTFGENQYEEAVGSVDLRSSAGGASLQDWLGIYSQNTVTGTTNLASYTDINALIAAGGDTFIPPAGPVLDQFRLTFDDPRTGLPSQTYYLDLEDIQATYPIGGAITNAADQIAAAINNLGPVNNPAPPSDAAVPDPAFAVSATVNSYGQLVIRSRANINIDASFPTGNPPDGGMDQDGLDYLGLTEGTYDTTDPYIDVQIGNDPPTRITIEPGDDETDLFDKLNKISGADPGVAGLAVDDDLTDPLGGGTLILRPGDDPTNPTFGGDIKIVGGSFTSVGGLSGTLAGTGIVEALFGTDNPVIGVPHELSTGTGQMEAFRRQGLGPNAKISTGIISSTNLIDFAQKMVNRQSSEANEVDAQITDETSFKDLLQRRLLDESGVNIEEELSHMVVIQTAFAAAARVITAIDQEFQDLLNAFR